MTSSVAWPVDEAWKREIKAELRAAGISYACLAAIIGCSHSAVRNLFSGGAPTSRYVARIHYVLGRPPPLNPVDTNLIRVYSESR